MIAGFIFFSIFNFVVFMIGYRYGHIAQIKNMKKLGENFDDVIRKFRNEQTDSTTIK